jgi:signal transduction histidine kinase
VAPAVRAAVASVSPPEGVVALREHDGPLVAGVDGALLERALAPVLDNALRYCRDAVVVETGSGPGGPWIRVQDDGPGVRADLVETAFEPGVSGAGEHGGAGLGLALARRLARAGGGDLHLEPGTGGARFLLTLPTA